MQTGITAMGFVSQGDIIRMNQASDRHYNNLVEKETPESTAVNFANVLNEALQKVNDQQVNAERLTQQMIAEPDSVEAHTVMIAAEKARMAMTFTKTVVDMAVRTYRDLANLR